jgi:hypothetical protein
LDEEFGWQVWHGSIRASWDWDHDERDTAVPVDAQGLDGQPGVLDPDAGCQTLIVGQLRQARAAPG